MRKNLLFRIVLLPVCIIQFTGSPAQSKFGYTSPVNNVTAPAFYKIILLPSIVSKCKYELDDIRILDDKGNQVPYLLKSDQPEFQEKSFIEFPILSLKKESDKLTHLVIQNRSLKSINELLLVIKNTDAERTVTISGSDDQKQWFVIKEHISLSNFFTRDQDRYVQSLSFPNSSYKFFEIVINGKDLLPVNIVRVGTYEGIFRNGAYLNIPAPVIIQKDSSNKSSYIILDFNDTYMINKVDLEVQGPKFFRRQLAMSYAGSNTDVYLGNFTISSDIAPGYTVNIKTKKLQLVIGNQDSPPLKIHSVKAYQLNKYLLTYLEPGKTYQLVFGDSSVGAPKYDLEFFKDSINNIVSEISLGSVIKNITKTSNQKQSPGKNMLVLWIIIITVLALLITLTFRMTKEVSGKDEV